MENNTLNTTKIIDVTTARFLDGLASKYMQEASTTPEFIRAAGKLGKALDEYPPALVEAVEFLTQVQMLAVLKTTLKNFRNDALAFDDLMYLLDIPNRIDKIELSPVNIEEVTSIFNKARGYVYLDDKRMEEYSNYVKD